MRNQRNQSFVIVMTALMLVTNVVADVEGPEQCDESEIKVTNDLQVTSAFFFNDLLALSFGIPATLNDSPFQSAHLDIMGDDEKKQFSTLLYTEEIDDKLEAMLSVSLSRYEEYSLHAYYYGGKGCPTVAKLDLKGNKNITDYLACIKKNGWAKCNLHESGLKNTAHK